MGRLHFASDFRNEKAQQDQGRSHCRSHLALVIEVRKAMKKTITSLGVLAACYALALP
jgi:hypothetical protein